METKFTPPEIEPFLVINERGEFTLLFKGEAEVRAAYPKTIFNVWATDLMGVRFLIMSPLDWAVPSVKRGILCGVIAWVLTQLPLGEPGISKAEHEQIHAIQKLWGQK